MGYFRVHFKADYFLFSQVVDFSIVKVPKSFRGRRLTIPSFELLLLVFFCFHKRVSCKASLLSFLDRSLCHTITRFSHADLSHSPKKNDFGKIHKENIQPHTLISTTPRVVPFATQNHSKKMRLKWHLQISEHTVFIRKWLMHRIVRLPLVVVVTQPITVN